MTEIYKGIDCDWELPYAPIVSSSFLEFGAKGLLFPENGAEEDLPVAPPAMPNHDDDSAAKFQVFVSNYLMDSLLFSYVDVYKPSFVTKPSDIPAKSPIQLNTSSLDKFFPGLEKKYGPNLPM